MNYTSSTVINSAFVRTYVMEHTRAQFELFVEGDLPTEEAISKAVDVIDDELIRRNREQAAIMETDEVKESLKALFEKEKKKEEDAVSVRYADTTAASTEKTFQRSHVPAGCDQDQTSRHLASMMKTKGKFYEEYHLNVEYKNWLVSQYGKEIKNEKRDVSTKRYYPGNADRRVLEAIKYGDSGVMGRLLWGGKRVVYPSEVIEAEAKEIAALAISKKRPLAPRATCYTSISWETCKKTNNMVAEQLKIQREYARERMCKKNMVKSTGVSGALREALEAKKQQQPPQRGETPTTHVLGADDSHDAALKRVQSSAMNTDGTTKASIIGAGLSAATAESDAYDEADYEQMERDAEEKAKKKQHKKEKKKRRKEKHRETPQEADVPMEDSNSPSSDVEEVPAPTTDRMEPADPVVDDPHGAYVTPKQRSVFGRPK